MDNVTLVVSIVALLLILFTIGHVVEKICDTIFAVKVIEFREDTDYILKDRYNPYIKIVKPLEAPKKLEDLNGKISSTGLPNTPEPEIWFK